MIPWLSTTAYSARSLFAKKKLDEQLSEEIRTHVELATEANVAKGMTPEEARYAALREFGNVASIQEQAREGRGWVWLEQWGKDIAYAVRSLRRAPGFSLTVIGTLSLGIGVATVVFKLVAPTILLPYAFPHSEELYLIGQRAQSGENQSLRPFNSDVALLAYREQTSAFAEYAIMRKNLVNVVIDHDLAMAAVHQVSADYFHTLGITPALGRTFQRDEFKEGRGTVVIISDSFWRAQFNADPEVLGRALVIDRQPCTIVGVLRPGQLWPVYLEHGDIFQPMAPLRVDISNPLVGALFAIGRLAPGVSAQQAVDAMRRVALPDLAPDALRAMAGFRADLLPLRDMRFPDKNTAVIVAAGVLLYLTAGLNAANLMLVRLLGRKQELSIRLALGGSRGRIIRLLALESAGLALAATVVVLAAAKWLFPALLLSITGQEAVGSVFLNWAVFGCIAGLSVVAGLGLALLPALRLSRADLHPGLKDGSAGLGESRRLAGLRNTLVVLQAAFAVILLSAAGLMVRSFEKIHATDLGLNPIGLFKVQLLIPPTNGLPNADAQLQMFERLRERLITLPGVKGVTFGEDTVLTGGFWGREQVVLKDGTYLATTGSFVAADFYQVAGLTVQRGRWFSPDQKTNEVVLSETMAKALYGESDPLDQTFKLKNYPTLVYRVVGIARDVRESVRSPSGMRFYAPCWWYPPLISTLVLRLDREPGKEFAGLVRRALYEFDPTLLGYNVTSFSDAIENSLWSELFAYKVLKILAGIGLGLAMVGMFSTVAYTVHCKRREFGVRLALGALPGDLLRLVLSRSLTTAALGVLVGVGGAIVLTRFMESLLFETTPYDPVVYVGVALLLLAMAALACWLPARRAAKVDPVVALRAE